VTLICAKFGKYMLNISKFIGRKTKWTRFLTYPVLFILLRMYISIYASAFRILDCFPVTCIQNLQSI